MRDNCPEVAAEARNFVILSDPQEVFPESRPMSRQCRSAAANSYRSIHRAMKFHPFFFLALILLMPAAAFRPSQVIMTSLRVTVLDRLGNPVSGAAVALYANLADYERTENPAAGPELSDEKGRVTFKDLHTQAYYVEVIKEDMTNYGGANLTEVLEKNKLNRVNIIIE